MNDARKTRVTAVKITEKNTRQRCFGHDIRVKNENRWKTATREIAEEAVMHVFSVFLKSRKAPARNEVHPGCCLTFGVHLKKQMLLKTMKITSRKASA